jgi:hypothetical protein
MASLHGVKRDIAVGVHPKLFCDSAIGKDIVTMSLDAVLESVVVEED